MTKIGLVQSVLVVHWNSPDSSDFPDFPDFPGVAGCGVDPALSELSAHQMARPGHLRTQAYSSIFSHIRQACGHGFQFSSMSAFPIIQTPSLHQDRFSQACGHHQDRGCSTCLQCKVLGEHHFSVMVLARCEQLSEGQCPCTLAFTASPSYACREVAE